MTLIACGTSGGGEDGCADPITDLSGHWRITETATDNSCDETLPAPYTLKLIQTGRSLTVVHTALEQRFSGEVCGASVTWKGRYPEDGGDIVLGPVAATIAGNTISGTRRWEWSDGFDNCSGTARFSGSRR